MKLMMRIDGSYTRWEEIRSDSESKTCPNRRQLVKTNNNKWQVTSELSS